MSGDSALGCATIATAFFAYAGSYWAFKCDCKEIRKNWTVIKPLLFALLSVFAVIIIEIVVLFIQD